MFNEEDICQHSKDMATNREKKRGKGGWRRGEGVGGNPRLWRWAPARCVLPDYFQLALKKLIRQVAAAFEAFHIHGPTLDGVGSAVLNSVKKRW